MAAKKSAKKKAKPKTHTAPKKPVASKAPPKEPESPLAIIPPVPEDEETKPKDEFFKEEDLKEFSVKDEEEDVEEDSSNDGEPAWTDEEY